MEPLPISYHTSNNAPDVMTFSVQAHEIASEKRFLGFKIGEALLWLCYRISWAAVLGGLFL